MKTLVIALALALTACTTIQKDNFIFEEQTTGMTGTMRGLDVLDENCAWISGSGGEYAFTTDGGMTWTKGTVPGADTLDFRDVHAFSGNTALLMSAGPGTASKIYRTDDAGQSWELCFTNPEPLGFFDGMDFLNDMEGVIFSDPVDSKLNLLTTSDGGKNWSRLNPATLPEIKKGEYAFAASGTNIVFDREGGLWIVTGGEVSRIWHAFSIDGPWEISSPPAAYGDPAEGLFSIAPKSKIRRIAVGGHYIDTERSGKNVVIWDEKNLGWYTPEGGKSLPFMECVRWISDKALVAAGPPGIFFSPDGGQSWEEIFESGFHTIDVCEKGRIGWLASNHGKVVKMTW